VFFLAIFVISIGWIFRALIAAVRREKNVWLFWGAPLAVIAAVWTAPRILLMLIGFAVAFFNGGTGK
jgi:hypothetical protein